MGSPPPDRIARQPVEIRPVWVSDPEVPSAMAIGCAVFVTKFPA